MISLEPRQGGGSDCPLCHASLIGGQTAACPGCQTVHHAACLVEFGRCATLGCGEIVKSAAKELAVEVRARGGFSALDGLFALGVGGLVAFMAAGMIHDQVYYSDPVYALVAFVLSIPLVPLAYGWIRLARRLAKEPRGVLIGLVERVFVGTWAFGQASVFVVIVGRSVDPRPGATVGLLSGVWVGFLVVHVLAKLFSTRR